MHPDFTPWSQISTIVITRLGAAWLPRTGWLGLVGWPATRTSMTGNPQDPEPFCALRTMCFDASSISAESGSRVLYF